MSSSVCETYETRRSVEHTVSRAFLTAHLLTASVELAETAIQAGLASWDSNNGSEEDLFQAVLVAAVGSKVGGTPSSETPDSTGLFLPGELRSVLDLSLQLRRCFVLRILAGLSVQMCARLLGLHPRHVRRYTCEALQCLPSGVKRSAFATELA